MAQIANGVMERSGAQATVQPDEMLVNSDFHGGGYGVLGNAEMDTIRLFAQMEGILLGPVYTGRAAAGMIDLIKKGFFRQDETVLFWHTGDTPTLFAEPYAGQF